MARRLYRALWLGLMMAIVTACAVGPAKLDVNEGQQSQLRQLETWHAEGKLGVRFADDAHSANFDWINDQGDFSLRLSGPFGQGTTWLRRQGRLITLESPDEPLRKASSAEQLMLEQLGWQVPVSNLRYWIKGTAAPEHKVGKMSRNIDGTLAELHQQGWTISYSRYSAYNGWALPGKLVAERGDLRLTMIIKNWQLPEPKQP